MGVQVTHDFERIGGGETIEGDIGGPADFGEGIVLKGDEVGGQGGVFGENEKIKGFEEATGGSGSPREIVEHFANFSGEENR